MQLTSPITFKKVFSDKAFLVILLLGFLLRFMWCTYFPTYPETDFMWYHVKGAEIAQGQGFLNGTYPDYAGITGEPTAFRPIGYPATLAAIYYFTGQSIYAGKMLNVFLSVLSIILLYIICRRFFSRKFALVCASLLSFSPLAIIYTGILGSETLFMTLLLFCAYFMLVSRRPIVTGVLIGYLALVRPIGMYFLACLVLFIFLDKNLDWKRKLRQSLAIVIFAFLIITPWIVRNYHAFGTPVYSTNGGYVLYVNNNPYATGTWSNPLEYPDSPFKKHYHEDWFDELSMHNEGKSLATKWIKQNPVSFIRLSFKRLANTYWTKLDDIMWGFTTGVDKWHPYYTRAILLQNILFKPFNIVLWFGMLVLFIKVIKDVFKKKKYRRNSPISIFTFILIMFLYFNSMIFVLEGNSRYVVPLFPFYSIVVVYVLSKFEFKRFWKKVITE